MTSIAINKSLAHRFQCIADKAIAVALVKKVHIDTETEHKVPFITNFWRPVEPLGIHNPPGIALLNRDGSASLIKWPTDEEMKIVTPKSSTLYHIEFERQGFHYTYAIRTKA